MKYIEGLFWCDIVRSAVFQTPIEGHLFGCVPRDQDGDGCCIYFGCSIDWSVAFALLRSMQNQESPKDEFFLFSIVFDRYGHYFLKTILTRKVDLAILSDENVRTI